MKTYLFCNAHLDPVWLWQWESGLSEALSTFRAAFKPFEIRTYKIENETVTETDMLEGAVPLE